MMQLTPSGASLASSRAPVSTFLASDGLLGTVRHISVHMRLWLGTNLKHAHQNLGHPAPHRLSQAFKSKDIDMSWPRSWTSIKEAI